MAAKKMPAKKIAAQKSSSAKPKNLGLGDNYPVGGSVGATAAGGAAAAAFIAGTLAYANSNKTKLKPYKGLATGKATSAAGTRAVMKAKKKK